MIGEPTNFVHTAHVGSGDVFSGMNSVSVNWWTSFHIRQNTRTLYLYVVAGATSLSAVRKNLYETEEWPDSILILSPKHLHQEYRL